jgi:hypothetical protein
MENPDVPKLWELQNLTLVQEAAQSTQRAGHIFYNPGLTTGTTAMQDATETASVSSPYVDILL